jgi:hypothetical protein
MLGKIALAAGLLTLGALASPQISSAAPMSPAAGLRGADAGTVQQAHYRGGSCRYWRRECAYRWGWHTHGYYRCLRRHDCGGGW